MKDSMKPCQHTVSDDVIYKEVVVIGNGPSGLVTSYMLAGNVPYLKQIPDDLPIDDMLRARLSNLQPGQSLYDTDLMELAEGLEGRSQNPISLLMDNLLRPCADMGIEADSLIEWRHEADKKVDHVVLGRGAPGGAWHTFPAGVRTLSPGAWLSLPPHSSVGSGRLPARSVAAYCRRYVKQCHLQRYMVSGVAVSGVRPVPWSAVPCARGCPLAARWTVAGYDLVTKQKVRYACARVIIATGGNDRPNTLDKRIPNPLYSLADIERAVTALGQRPDKGTVLVVGSGVSGADAVCAALGAGLRVAHAHRDPAPALAALAPDLYPDYYQVYKMMCDGSATKYENYTPYPEHIILKVKVDPQQETPTKLTPEDSDIEEAIRPKKVKLLNIVTNEIVEINVSLIAVLIGSKPDLSYLPNFDLHLPDLSKQCPKCSEEKHAPKRKIDDQQRQCFFKNHWLYLKSMLGQSIQSCKSRLNTEINGNTDLKCIEPDCNKEDSCNCDDPTDCKCQVVTHKLDSKLECTCESPFADGIGFGLDPKKPVDCRANPLAIDKTTHELLNTPKGLYSLGPLTADNFIRFIPGGALAIVADIHKKRKGIIKE